jgi:hypothetical protein
VAKVAEMVGGKVAAAIRTWLARVGPSGFDISPKYLNRFKLGN